MRIAVLMKQVPRTDALSLGSDGRLVREGIPLEMNPYCRRAIAKGIELAKATEGHCTAITLGPPSAEEILREAIAGGADEGLLVSDNAFAGSDTLATSRALAATVRKFGPFDLIITGKNSVDADTGQVGPAVAEILNLPFAGSIRDLELDANFITVRCEREDGWFRASVQLPAVVSAAERLCRPLKVPVELRGDVARDRIKRVSAEDLGPGPWGQSGSPTRVGPVRVLETSRSGLQLTGKLDEQVRTACQILFDRGAFGAPIVQRRSVVPSSSGQGSVVAIISEPGAAAATRELACAAVCLAEEIGGTVTALSAERSDPVQLGSWGIDRIIHIHSGAAEDVARAGAEWAASHKPWAILSASTMWGREVASRLAARVGAGLTGDAIGLEVQDGRLVAWKPAFGGQLVAAITAITDIQMVTLRPGAIPVLEPRTTVASVASLPVANGDRIRVLERRQDDQADALLSAWTVVGVGTGVPVGEYERLQPLLRTLQAELAATRKVTDLGWLPRSRQVGLTGHSISPRLYIGIGLSGNLNHQVGIRGAGSVLAINSDAKAPIFKAADVGIVGDWREVVPLFVSEIRTQREAVLDEQLGVK